MINNILFKTSDISLFQNTDKDSSCYFFWYKKFFVKAAITKFIVFLFVLVVTPELRAQTSFSVKSGGYQLYWNIAKDSAVLVKEQLNGLIWRGSLLPAFWLQTDAEEKQYVKAKLAETPYLRDNGGTVPLTIGKLGKGILEISYQSGGVQFSKLEVEWNDAPPQIISMYFGSSGLQPGEKVKAITLEQPFWPDWEAAGFCVPSAKGNPVQSFFRMWDLGHANLPLGSFGPSLGTPYAAAFPRPFYSCAFGNNEGWAVFGAGTVPEAAMVLKIHASNGCLQYLYREDLWGNSNEKKRIWHEPLRISWAGTAYDAYQSYFHSFGPLSPVADIHQRNIWNTWGDFRIGDYNLKEIANKTIDFEADVLAIDQSWESSEGSGMWSEKRFPAYKDDLKYIRSQGLKTGFWQNVVWIEKPEEYGLTAQDLLCGADGQPIKTSWNMNPHGVGNYCLDPSSLKAAAFIRSRMQKIMKELKPELIKLDFAYAIPSPNVATARDPEMRGEKLAFSLLKLVADAAREVNPNVTIQYYSIHPLFRQVQNLLSLDDLGDAGSYEAEGHGQWSIWSSLAGQQGTAIMASSGYDWDADDEVLLNTAVIGAQSSVLPRNLDDGSPIPLQKINKRVALAMWHRRSVGWTPLWLNSHKGSLAQEPKPVCWGRLERWQGGNQLTALALRDSAGLSDSDKSIIRNIRWKGRWAIISQDEQNIFDAGKVALVPFDGGFVEIPVAKSPAIVVAVINKTEKAFSLWEWKDGTLKINAEGFSEEPGLNGFLLYK